MPLDFWNFSMPTLAKSLQLLTNHTRHESPTQQNSHTTALSDPIWDWDWEQTASQAKICTIVPCDHRSEVFVFLVACSMARCEFFVAGKVVPLRNNNREPEALPVLSCLCIYSFRKGPVQRMDLCGTLPEPLQQILAFPVLRAGTDPPGHLSRTLACY
jgi:hypothetical protein